MGFLCGNFGSGVGRIWCVGGLVSILAFLTMLAIDLDKYLNRGKSVSSAIGANSKSVSRARSILSSIADIDDRTSSGLRDMDSRRPIISARGPRLIALAIKPCRICSTCGSHKLGGAGSKFSCNITGGKRPRDASIGGRGQFSNVDSIGTLTLSAISASGHVCLAFSYNCRCGGLATSVLSALGRGGIGTTFFIALPCTGRGPTLMQEVVSRNRVINGRDGARPIFPSVSHRGVTGRV